MNTLEYQVGPPLPVACLAAVTGRVGVAADRVLGWGGDSRERKWPAEGACEWEALRPLESGMERSAGGGGR